MIDIKLNNRKVGEANTPLEALEFIVENEKHNSYNPSLYDFIDERIEEAINEYKDDPDSYQYKFYAGVKDAVENGFIVLDNGNFEYIAFKEAAINADDLKYILHDVRLTKYSIENKVEMDILNDTRLSIYDRELRNSLKEIVTHLEEKLDTHISEETILHTASTLDELRELEYDLSRVTEYTKDYVDRNVEELDDFMLIEENPLINKHFDSIEKIVEPLQSKLKYPTTHNDFTTELAIALEDVSKENDIKEIVKDTRKWINENVESIQDFQLVHKGTPADHEFNSDIKNGEFNYLEALPKIREYLEDEFPDQSIPLGNLKSIGIGVLTHDSKEEIISSFFPKADGLPLSEKTNKVLDSMEESEVEIYLNAKTMKLNDVVDLPKGYLDDLLYPTDSNHHFMATYFLEREIDGAFSFQSIQERWNTMKEIGSELLSPPQLELFPHKFNPNPNEVEITPESLKTMEKEKLKYIERGR